MGHVSITPGLSGSCPLWLSSSVQEIPLLLALSVGFASPVPLLLDRKAAGVTHKRDHTLSSGRERGRLLLTSLGLGWALCHVVCHVVPGLGLGTVLGAGNGQGAYQGIGLK